MSYVSPVRPMMLADRVRVAVSALALLVGTTMCSVYDSSLLSVSGGGASAGSAGTDSGSGGGIAGGGLSGTGGTDDPSGGTAGSGGTSGGPGGTSGTSGDGGSASGGTGTVEPPIFNGNLELVDDLEDGDNLLYVLGTDRDGVWFVAKDNTTGTMDPFPFAVSDEGGNNGSTRGVHVTAEGFTDWGANIAFNFMHDTLPSHQPAPYDASAYCGVAFWAKRSATTPSALVVRVGDLHTHPAGGICVENSTGSDGCFDHHRRPVALTIEWAYHEVLFSQMAQQTWGYQAPDGLRTDNLYHVEFLLGPNQDYEVWIDDVALIMRDGDGNCP